MAKQTETRLADTGIPDENGKPLSHERRVLIAEANRALMALTDWERGLVLCWFCRNCNRYVGPDEGRCHCGNDE